MNSYPSSLIPKVRFKRRINITQAIRKHTLYVVRRVDFPQDQVFNRLGYVIPDVLKVKDVPDMSMNLLGGVYSPCHLKYHSFKEAAAQWNGEIKLPMRIYNKCKSVLSNYSALYIPARAMHGISVPFEGTWMKDHNKNFAEFAANKKYTSGQRISVNGVAEVVHAPTRLNYWHVVLEIVNPLDSKPLKKATNVFSKYACDNLLQNVIAVHGVPNLPSDFEKMDGGIYC